MSNDVKNERAECSIMYLDDHVGQLEAFKQIFDEDYKIYTANKYEDGIKIFEQNKEDIGIVLSDLRLSETDSLVTGVKFLEEVKRQKPEIVRILVTGYYHDNVESIIDSINVSGINQFITKPWDNEQLEKQISQYKEIYLNRNKQKKLIGKKMSSINQLIQTNKAVGFNYLSEGLNHHLRNALTPIKAFIDMVPDLIDDTKNGEIDDDWKDSWEMATNKIEKISSLLEKLWETSSFNKIKYEDEISIISLIMKCVESYQDNLDAKKIECDCSSEDGIPNIISNEERLRYLLNLIIEEAISQLNENQTFWFNIKNGENKSENDIIIEYEDNGTNIDDDKLKSLFEPFFVRNSEPGEFGINLSASAAIVTQLGGQISANKRNRGGITITIHLPLKVDLNNASLNQSLNVTSGKTI